MTTLVQTRIDNKIKVGAERILKSMGMSLNDGIRIVKEPNEETMKAVERVNRGEGLRKVSFEEFKQMLRK